MHTTCTMYMHYKVKGSANKHAAVQCTHSPRDDDTGTGGSNDCSDHHISGSSRYCIWHNRRYMYMYTGMYFNLHDAMSAWQCF